MSTGTLFIISAPSGAGKTSLVAQLLEQLEHVQVSISHTTRAPRPGESDGVNYHFVSHDHFAQMDADNAFLEQAEVHGNRYGTSRHWVEQSLNSGTDVILEIDWQGAAQIRELYSQCVSIFILPPSLAALRDRLNGRGQDSEQIINQRVAAAREEMVHYHEADYLVINDQFDLALEELACIIRAQRCIMPIQQQSRQNLLQDLLS